MAHNIKGTIDQDRGSSTRPLSTQRCKCRMACRRPFPACSTALCMWLPVVEAATTRSARIPPCALCSRIPPGALPSSLHAGAPVFGASARPRMFVCMRLRWARRDNAVTRCKNCHADAQRIQAARAPFIPAAIYLQLSCHTTQ